MEDFRLVGKYKFPITPSNPHYDERWVFEPSSSSFYIALGTGLLKSVLEFPSQHYEYKILAKIYEVPAIETDEIEHMEESKNIFAALLQSIKKPRNPSGKLVKLYRYLANQKRNDILYAIDLITRGLFKTKDLTKQENLLANEADIPEEILLRSICEDLEINIHILTNTAIRKIEVKESSPLITLYLENNSYSLMFRSHDHSDFSRFPYILEKTQQEIDIENAEIINRILLEGFDPLRVSEEKLSTITMLIERSISCQNLAKEIQKKIMNSKLGVDSYVPRCGQKHSKQELISSCKTGNQCCPCDVKLSRKNIDEILGRIRKRNGTNSIRNLAGNATNSIDQPLTSESLTSGPLTPEALTSGPSTPEPSKPERTLERLDCKHRGEDPINCHGHKLCIECRYQKLDQNFKCSVCDRKYTQKEKETIWESLAASKKHPTEYCEVCKSYTYLPERNLCMTCGKISMARSQG